MTLKQLINKWERNAVRIAMRDDGHRVLTVVERLGKYDCLCYIRLTDSDKTWDVSCDLQGVDADRAIKWALEGRTLRLQTA